MRGDRRDHIVRARARGLRSETSDAEAVLWRYLRARRLSGVKFRRQYPVGPYIADFCCPEAGLIVEADGGQHAQRVHSDAVRTAYLIAQGFRVIRFWNHDILARTESVLEQIAAAVRQSVP